MNADQLSDHKYYPITWVSGTLNGESCWLGFCGKTRKLYHIAPDRGGMHALIPFLVHDLIIDREGNCEEAKGCMNQQCPLNRTTPASYWARHGLSGPPPSKSCTFSGLELPDDIEASSGVVTSTKGSPVLKLSTRKATKVGAAQ